MKSTKLHGLDVLPAGLHVKDVLPAFSDVKHEVRVGKFSHVCASCRKPFNAVRKPRKEIRLYPVDIDVPFAWAYPICGGCVAKYRNGGVLMDGVLAAVEAFHLGEAPAQ
jgi:hypothetical protein